MYLYRS